MTKAFFLYFLAFTILIKRNKASTP
jgi:hypothetical protein